MNGPDPLIQMMGTGLVARIKEVTRAPGEKQAVLAATVASMCAAFSDEEWEEMMAASKMACGIPDCDCEIYGEQQFIGMNVGREHHKAVMSRRAKGGK